MGKQISPDITENFLGCPHHGLGITVGGQNSDSINHRRKQDPPHQRPRIPCGERIDYRTYHIGSQQVGNGADRYQNSYKKEKKAMLPI